MKHRYSVPHKCPKCKDYYGILVQRDEAPPPCANCKTIVVRL